MTIPATASAVPSRVRRNTPSFGGRQTLLRAITAEWKKMSTLTSTWTTSAIAVLVSVIVGAAVIIVTADNGELAATASDNIIAGVQFGQVIVAVLGALAITGEYSSGQIRSSLAAVPKRTRLFLAKAVVVAAYGFVLGVVSMFATWLAAFAFVGSKAGSLTDVEFLGYFWGTGLTYAGTALLALALGFLLRSTAGAITTVMTLLFVISIPLSLMQMRWEWVTSVRAFEPLNVAIAVYDPFQHVMQWGVADTTHWISQGVAALGFAAWSLVPLAAAWAVFVERDA